MKTSIKEELSIPAGVDVKLDGKFLVVKGPKGEVRKNLTHPLVQMKLEPGKVTLSTIKLTRKEKTMVYTMFAHLKNIVKGVVHGHVYKMKVCSSHFPINVAVSGNKILIKNFLGEKEPRIVTIKQGVKVTIADKDITLESPDKEAVGQLASDIEIATIPGNRRDIRVFQDGIFMTDKAGKKQ